MVDILLRSDSPDDLTATQIDQNFKNLRDALNSLINNPGEPIGVVSATIDGRKLTFNLSNSTTIGPFYLDFPELHNRGNWEPDISYDELDIFRKPGIGLYMVQINHISASTFDKNAVDIASGNPLYLEMFAFAPAENIVYDMGFFYPAVLKDIPSSIDRIYEEPIIRTILLPVVPTIGSFHRARMRIAPTTAAQDFTLYQNGTSIGSVHVAIGANEGSVTLTADTTFTADVDVFECSRQAIDDATASGFSLMLAAQQVLG
jgi:hypothetical protein